VPGVGGYVVHARDAASATDHTDHLCGHRFSPASSQLPRISPTRSGPAYRRALDLPGHSVVAARVLGKLLRRQATLDPSAAAKAAGPPPTSYRPDAGQRAYRGSIALSVHPGVGHPDLRTSRAARPLDPTSEDGGPRRERPRGRSSDSAADIHTTPWHIEQLSTRRIPELLNRVRPTRTSWPR